MSEENIDKINSGETFYFLSAYLSTKCTKERPEGFTRWIRHQMLTKNEVKNVVINMLREEDSFITKMDVFLESELDEPYEFDEEREKKYIEDKKSCFKEGYTKREFEIGGWYQSWRDHDFDIIEGRRDKNGKWLGEGDDPDIFKKIMKNSQF